MRILYFICLKKKQETLHFLRLNFAAQFRPNLQCYLYASLFTHDIAEIWHFCKQNDEIYVK